MNASVIVLDSSDSEDEKKTKSKFQQVLITTNKKSSNASTSGNAFPLTTSVVSTTTTTVNASTSISSTNLNSKATIKAINIPSGITVTRHSPVVIAKPKPSTIITTRTTAASTMSTQQMSTPLKNLTGNRPALRITTVKPMDIVGPAITPKAPPLLAKYPTNNQGVKIQQLQQQAQQTKQQQWGVQQKMKPQQQQQQQQKQPIQQQQQQKQPIQQQQQQKQPIQQQQQQKQPIQQQQQQKQPIQQQQQQKQPIQQQHQQKQPIQQQQQQKQPIQQQQQQKQQPVQRQPQNQQRFPKQQQQIQLQQQNQQKPVQKQPQPLQQMVKTGTTKRFATPPVLSGTPPKLIKLQVEDTARLVKTPTTPSSMASSNLSLGAALKSCVSNSSNVTKLSLSNPTTTTTVNRKVISHPVLKPPETTTTITSMVPPRLSLQSQSTTKVMTSTPKQKPRETSAPTLMPIMSSVHTITASATPPLRLLASPPHSSAALKEPTVLHLNLPSDTTVTAQPKVSPTIQKLQPKTLRINSSSSSIGNSSSNSSPSVINRNVTNAQSSQNTPKSSASITVTSKPTVSTANIKMTTIINNNSNNNNGISSNKTNNNNNSKQSTASPVPTLISTSNSNNNNNSSSKTTTTTISPIKRITPTTILQKTDEAWQQRIGTSNVSMSENENTPKAKPKGIKHQQPIRISSNNNNTTTTTNSETANMITSQTPPTPPLLSSTPTPTASVSIVKESTKTDLNGSPTNNISSIDLTKSFTAEEGSKIMINKKEENKDERAPLEPEYEELLKECRKADTTSDMERLIEVKLVKYYYDVHATFVRSRGFRKTVRKVIDAIRLEPDLVYLHVKTVIDELKVRRKAKFVAVAEEETPSLTSTNATSGNYSNSNSNSNNSSSNSKQTMETENTVVEKSPEVSKPPSTLEEADVSISSTGNRHTDEMIRKLNRALHIVKKRIETLENSEVDWNDDDSSYMQVERFKKRACLLYEKICDLTGENKNALRLARKPIQFKDTEYTQFNKTLQAFVNRTHEFPDYYDVLHMLEHCNQTYAFGLASFEMKRIAQDAFTKVGKLLQARRKTDLYETVTYFTGNAKDPATEDTDLAAKLNENKKNQKKISEILEKYAREQDLTAEEQREARLKERQQTEVNSNDTSSSSPTTNNKDKVVNISSSAEHDDSDDDDDEDDEEEYQFEDMDVDNLANGHLSDADSDAETDIKVDETTKEVLVVLEKDTATKTNTKSDDDVVSLNDSQDELERLLDAESKALKSKSITAKADCNGLSLNAAQRSSINAMEKTVNNNNTMRVKTGLNRTTSSTTTTTTKSVPNGKVNTQANAGTTEGDAAVQIEDFESVILQSSPQIPGVQTLKIMSVSSLNANCVDQPLQQLRQLHQTPSRDPSPFAEIIISDEES